VLFQRDDEYIAIGDRLAAAGVKTWVNCPRRMQPGYQQLRQELQGQTPFAMRVLGSGWGLACNGIHFLDLAAFLFGRDDLQITEIALQPGVVSSKRPGFVEYFGQLRGTFGDGSTLELNCSTAAVEPIVMGITTSRLLIAIREDRQELRIGSRTSGEPERIVPLPPVFQSQLSQLVVQDLLDRGECPLTPYAESCRLHRPFLAALLDHYRRHVDAAAMACPIT
jgi:predicted dehydrogenase